MSGFIVSLLTGLAVLLAAVLNLVPKPVLFGVFLYMGISATAGIHLLERAVLMLMPVKHHPNVPYVKKVSNREYRKDFRDTVLTTECRPSSCLKA